MPMLCRLRSAQQELEWGLASRLRAVNRPRCQCLQCITSPCRSRRTWPGVARHGAACLARQPRPAALRGCRAPPLAVQPPRGRCSSRTPSQLARPSGHPHRWAYRAHANTSSAAIGSRRICKWQSVLHVSFLVPGFPVCDSWLCSCACAHVMALNGCKQGRVMGCRAGPS